MAQACNSVFPVILGCIVPCIQLQSSLLLWCMLGCTLMLQHMLSCTSLQLPLTLSVSFMLGHLLLQKTHICFSIAFNFLINKNTVEKRSLITNELSSFGTSSFNNNGMEGEVMVSIGEKDEPELQLQEQQLQ